MALSTALGHLALYILYVIGLCAVMMGLSALLGPRSRPAQATDEPFESGIVSVGTARFRFSAKWYLIAMFFVIFDLETVYILTWGVTAREAGWAGYVEVMIFVMILLAALVYLWRVGALEWAPKTRRARKIRGS